MSVKIRDDYSSYRHSKLKHAFYVLGLEYG